MLGRVQSVDVHIHAGASQRANGNSFAPPDMLVSRGVGQSYAPRSAIPLEFDALAKRISDHFVSNP